MSPLDFRPFRAWRYETRQVHLEQVIAPPYDVIAPAHQEALYARSPYNVVRLILGKEADFYEEAARRWQEWTQKGILAQDSSPAIYLYEQEFSHPRTSQRMRRLAMIGILKLDQAEAVLRHEATFEGPRRDRLALLEKTKTNLSPIFGLYQDSKRRLPGLFSSCRKTAVLLQAQDEEGIIHRGWAIQNPGDQKLIQEVIRNEKIFIADGHHRFETAVEYRRQMREKFRLSSAEAPYDFVMMALVAARDEGLIVLPTHRIIRSFANCNKGKFLDRLRPYFDLLSCPDAELFSKLNQCSYKEKVFGLLLGREGNFLIRLKSLNAVTKQLPCRKPPIWYEIEANLLSRFVFTKLWGLSEEERQKQIEYTRSWEDAVQTVREGRAEAAFLMRTPEIDRIQKLADTGERMPQKTTYFYPKLASGLFFYHHG